MRTTAQLTFPWFHQMVKSLEGSTHDDKHGHRHHSWWADGTGSQPAAGPQDHKADGCRVENARNFQEEWRSSWGGTSGIGAVDPRRIAKLGAKVGITGRPRLDGQLLVNDIEEDKLTCRRSLY